MINFASFFNELAPHFTLRTIQWLWEFALLSYPGNVQGPHGPLHWFRVIQLGLYLSKQTGADARTVYLFGIFHDMKRSNDNHDPFHGARSIKTLLKEVDLKKIGLLSAHIELLFDAIRFHSMGTIHSDITIATCWDADRLDLIRFSKEIESDYLSLSFSKSKQTLAYAKQLFSQHKI